MTLTQREAFARTMEHLVNHDSHGYTQGNRWGNGCKETIDLGDGVTVEVMQGDRDCSSAIISALNAVGVDTGDATYTGNMKNNILNSGLFVWKSANEVANRGDIYLNIAFHTAMSTDDESTQLAEFSIAENGTAYGEEGDQTGYESHICAYYDYPWDGFLHWKGDGETLGGSVEENTNAGTSTPTDDVDTLARAVIRGEYGVGNERKQRLGDKYDAVQARVNAILNGTANTDTSSENDVDIEQLAKDVIRGNYGNGKARKSALGDLYDRVQQRVNEILRG